MSSIDPKGGDEVFVELEPDAVAGVDVGLVDPVTLSASCCFQRCFVAGRVSFESDQNSRKSRGQRREFRPQRFEFIEDACIPCTVRMVIWGKLICFGRSDLPVCNGTQHPGVERQEIAVHDRSDVLRVSLLAFVRELTFVHCLTPDSPMKLGQ